MNEEQKLKAVRKVIIEANPEIAELKFGCEVIIFEGRHNGNMPRALKPSKAKYAAKQVKAKKVYVVTKRETILTKKESEIEILGRPIRLSDVLIAISSGNGFCPSGIKWNISKDDLNFQSPETISFLFDLLCK